MNLKDYDNIEIPQNLNDYIDKGIKKGIEYEKQSKNKQILKQVAAALVVSTITLTTTANIPVFASELVKIPIIGNIVKILDFTNSTNFGGVVTDGAGMIVDSLSKNTINIYFSKDNEVINDLPSYEVNYSEYPYTLFITFHGVREFNDTQIQEKIKDISLVKDVYRIVTLDDSSCKIAIKFNENVDFKVSEHKNPGMLKIAMKANTISNDKKEAYFIRSKEFNFGEQLAQIEEILMNYENVKIQKSSMDKYIVELGPYENEKDAKEILKNIENENYLGTTLSIEKRMKGQGPK